MVVLPTPATWDDLDTTDWDTLYTYDDPMRSKRIADAIDLGTVTRSGPSAAISWTEAGDVVDGLEPEFARDHFIRPGLGSQILNTNPYFNTNVTGWSALGGSTINTNSTAHEGAFSMVVVPDGVTSDPTVQTDPGNTVPVIAGRNYTWSLWVRPTLAGTRTHGVIWFDAALSVLGFSTMSYTDTPVVWTYHEQTIQAPVGAAWARLTTSTPGVAAVGSSWRVDEFKLVGPPVGALGWQTTNLPVPGYTWTTNSVYFSMDDDQGVCTPNVLNSLYTAVLLDQPSVVDFDVAIKVRATELFLGASGSVFLLARWQDNLNHLRFRMDFNIDQIIGLGIEARVAGTAVTNVGGLAVGPLHDSNTYLWLRAQGAGPILRIKAWTDGVTQPDAWGITRNEPLYASTAGPVGVGFRLTTGNTNGLPYRAFEVDEFFSGVNTSVDVNRITTSLSLDDGLPDGATDTGASGVPDMTASLAGPIGVDSRVFWSTFRPDQPYGDIDRDIAGVEVSSGLVTEDGIRTARLFTGQMADTPVSGRDVSLKGISRNRLRMTTPIQPPAINGPYEGCEGTWPVSYALLKSGVYPAPPPIPGCRLYMPFHGSIHPMIPDTNGETWPYGQRKYNSPSVANWVRPTFVDGPFVAGLYNHMGPGDTRTLNTNVDIANFAPGEDFWSQRNARGRIEFWVRGDPTDLLASQNNTEGFIGQIWIAEPNAPNRFIMVAIGCPDRRPYMQFSDGVNSGFARLDPVPSDGEWHFIGMSWNLTPGSQNFRLTMDTQSVAITSSMSAGNLPVTDTVNRVRFKMYLPISELRITTGKFGPGAQAAWVRDLPYDPGAIMRRSDTELEGLAEVGPTEAYTYINKFAQADLAWTGYDADDQFRYLPPRYWGEVDQQVVEETLTPDVNLTADFTPTREVNKVYNQVAVTYKSSSVQQGNTKIYESTEQLAFPSHQEVFFTFAFQVPVIQLRDYAFAVPNGTTLAAAPPNPYNYPNFITANTAQDATGTYADINTLKVRVVSWNSGAVTLGFLNNLGSTLYTVNDVSLPTIGIGGRVLLVAEDTFIASSESSVARRNVRMLPVSAPVIQRLNDAAGLARELVARLSQPRIRFTTKVFANPERQPGRLVRVEDPYVTGIGGLFRITAVTTTQEGHNISQVVTAQESLPALVWGVGTWGETVWGESST